MKEAAVEHLKSCNDKKAIAAYQKKIAEDKEKEKRKAKAVETQEDVMAFKTWEHNGRQVFYCENNNSDSFYELKFSYAWDGEEVARVGEGEEGGLVGSAATF